MSISVPFRPSESEVAATQEAAANEGIAGTQEVVEAPAQQLKLSPPPAEVEDVSRYIRQWMANCAQREHSLLKTCDYLV